MQNWTKLSSTTLINREKIVYNWEKKEVAKELCIIGKKEVTKERVCNSFIYNIAEGKTFLLQERRAFPVQILG
jgi:hypothetical protein